MFHMLFLALSFYIENYCELCAKKHINNCFLLLTWFCKISFFSKKHKFQIPNCLTYNTLKKPIRMNPIGFVCMFLQYLWQNISAEHTVIILDILIRQISTFQFNIINTHIFWCIYTPFAFIR